MSGSDEPSRPLVSRRTTLRAGTLGAAVAWTLPLVQVISMESASAASGPPPARKSVGAGPTARTQEQQGTKGGQ